MEVKDDIDRTTALKDYVDAYDSWRKHMWSFNWCINTGHYGVVSEAGISDIDCLALIADGSALLATGAHDSWLRSQTEKRQYLFDHGPMLVPFSGIALLPNVFFFNNLTWDSDNAGKLEVVSPDMRRFLELMWVLYCLPKGVRFMCKNKLRLRKTLSILKKLHISELILQNLLSPSKPSLDPLIKTKMLRKKFMQGYASDENSSSTLIEEVHNSIKNICTYLDMFGDWLGYTDARAYEVSSPYGTIVGSQKTTLDFKNKEASQNRIKLHSNIVSLVFFGRCQNENWQHLSERYVAAQKGLCTIFTREKVSYPLVRPFNVEPNFWGLHPIFVS
jgi:hypothetical protein